jgi:hypothetical protein
MKRAKYKVHQDAIRTLSDFIKCVQDQREETFLAGGKSDFLFRGLPADLPLLPKVGWMEWHGKRFHVEQQILEEFERTTPRFSKLTMGSLWDVIAVAQHHGLPTRLLDWSQSAVAALWFVVRDGPKRDGQTNKQQCGVVWILKPEVDDFLSSKEIKEYTPFNIRRSWIFRPRVIADRIHAQSGVFTVHASDHKSGPKRLIALETNSIFAEKLYKISIPPDCFLAIREQLQVCGINEATLFPDLDGFCKHLKWRYAREFSNDGKITHQQITAILLQLRHDFVSGKSTARRRVREYLSILGHRGGLGNLSE